MALSGTSPLTMDRLRDTTFWTYFLRHDQNDLFSMALQINHDKRPGDPVVDVHLHVSPAVIPGADQNVYFRTYWTWSPIGGTIPLLASWTGPVFTTLIIRSTYAVGQHLVHPLPAPSV